MSRNYLLTGPWREVPRHHRHPPLFVYASSMKDVKRHDSYADSLSRLSEQICLCEYQEGCVTVVWAIHNRLLLDQFLYLIY